MQTLILPFLGKRNYIYSASLFDALATQYSLHGKISFKINNIIHSPYLQVETSPNEKASAYLQFGDQLENSLYISELEYNQSVKRENYNEEDIINRSHFFDTSVSFQLGTKTHFSYDIISLNKKLHQIYIQKNSDEGQWIFTRFDLDFLPKTLEDYTLKLTNILSKKLTCAKLFSNDIPFGSIYFSWRDYD